MPRITSFENIRANSHIHLMGICGTAMASLAGLLQQKGFQVTGSDQNIYPPMSTQLQKLNIPIVEQLQNLKSLPDIVIVGNVMTRKHAEVEFLLNSRIPYTSLPEMIGQLLIDQKKSIVPCGTHGKTTCTALLSWILKACDKDPGFLIGGIPQNFEFSFHSSSEDIFVIEGDEYDTAFFDKVPKFTHYKPQYVILTSIEMDHIDIYPDFNAVKVAFQQLLRIIPTKGLLVANGEDPVVCDMLKMAQCPYFLYALCREKSYKPPHYWVENIQKQKEGISFEVLSSDSSKNITLELSLFGHHNIANALAVYALIAEMPFALSKKAIQKAFKTFLGVKRRQEIIGRAGGIVVIDDFAHHPTAVKQTIQSVQEHFKGEKVISIFEPRSATSRRAIFQQEYVDAFVDAQFVILSDVYKKDMLALDERLNIEKLVLDIRNKQTNRQKVFATKSIEDIIRLTRQNVCKGDVVLIMSNGGFQGFHSKLLSALKNKYYKQN